MGGEGRKSKSVAARDAILLREGLLANLIRTRKTNLDPETLSRSYAVPVDRVREIIVRNGGSIG